MGTHGIAVIKALSYKMEGRELEIRRSELVFFNLPNPSCRSRPWDFTQLLTEMSIRSRKIMFLASRARPVHRANNHTAI
jgi:hypothetical protein